jgi:CRP-like cAMP-binding protein
VPEGHYLFRAGEPADSFLVIQAGQVELLRRGSEDRLALLGAGDLVGEDSAFEGEVRAYDARAVASASLVRVEAAAFGELVRARPEVAARVVSRLGLRLLQARAACLAMARPSSAQHESPGASVSRPGAVPRLIHVETGTQFAVAGPDVLVGRADPRTRFQPDIELSGVDTHRSLSRRHVRLKQQADGFVIVEEPRVANGTFVNGQRLASGVPVPITDGDEVCFGLIKTVFRTT